MCVRAIILLCGNIIGANLSVEAFTLWKRLDVQGRDACWLEKTVRGWELYGAAVFAHENGPAFINYDVEYDASWNTIAAHTRGRIGHAGFDHEILKTESGWTLDGRMIDGLQDISQIDFGFTPATNLPQIKKLDLAMGARSVCDAVWFDVGKKSLTRFNQFYERKSERCYWYESPSANYSAILIMADNGFIAEYPNLWRAETDRDPT